MTIITSDTVLAYANCPRKAHLLLFSKTPGKQHEYVRLLDQQACANRAEHFSRLREQNDQVETYSVEALERGSSFLVEVTLSSPPLEACCDILTKVRRHSAIGKYSYEPTIIIGTHRVAESQKLALAFAGYVLEHLQSKLPESGTIIDAQGQPRSVKLEGHYKKVRTVVRPLRKWVAEQPADAPGIVLNGHCSYCQFHKICRKKAEQDDNLSLLARMTPKMIQRYQKKGIFTVHQLSFLFRPRRGRKRRNKPHSAFNLELQALALRTQKIYIQKLPELARQPVELFLDLEGIPDRGVQYLFGLIVQQNGKSTYQAFWADNAEQEEQIWRRFLAEVRRHPDAPIYHYGQYESRALEKLARTCDTSWHDVQKRLVNLNTYIYAQIYFPTRSNTLKDIGKYLGAEWSDPDASGLQSLVWRQRWEQTGEQRHKRLLLQYNEEDCRALQLLTDKLVAIAATAGQQPNVDFADRPKQHTTAHGAAIHEELERLLRSAHADYDKKRLALRVSSKCKSDAPKKKGAPKGHQAFQRVLPSKANKTIRVRAKLTCPIHRGQRLIVTEEVAEKFIIDLRFTKNGCRKFITQYVGKKSLCDRCRKHHDPPAIKRLGGQLFGHAFQAWAVYQRIILRLPYRVITQVMEDLFGERTTAGTVINFMRYLAKYYARTEKLLVEHILQSPFVHVDETRINIQGHDRYVWIFTDGNHVVFRITETRESTVVQSTLAGYEGVLISDFYPGYDAVPCKQQRCLVHLIRDINDELWKAPYDTEFEQFVAAVKNLLVPVFEAVDKYGLKKRHLRKFQRNVDRFYDKNIDTRDYKSEPAIKFYKRFIRYRETLFTFLHNDGVPWNNNTGERGIRHLAIQRKISGTFFEDAVVPYLQLLGMAQTCRFQDKSFLRFLISGELDIDRFKRTRPMQISKPVGPDTGRGQTGDR